MRVKVCYYGYVRKNGTCNSVLFDTERKTFTDKWMDDGFDASIGAESSRDINTLRETLISKGYRKV